MNLTNGSQTEVVQGGGSSDFAHPIMMKPDPNGNLIVGGWVSETDTTDECLVQISPQNWNQTLLSSSSWLIGQDGEVVDSNSNIYIDAIPLSFGNHPNDSRIMEFYDSTQGVENMDVSAGNNLATVKDMIIYSSGGGQTEARGGSAMQISLAVHSPNAGKGIGDPAKSFGSANASSPDKIPLIIPLSHGLPQGDFGNHVGSSANNLAWPRGSIDFLNSDFGAIFTGDMVPAFMDFHVVK